jgi:hypothetical protein
LSRSCQKQNGSIENRSGAICSNISSNHWPTINNTTVLYEYHFEVFLKKMEVLRKEKLLYREIATSAPAFARGGA